MARAKRVEVGDIVLWRPRHDDWKAGVRALSPADLVDYRVPAVVTRVYDNGRIDIKAFVNDDSRPYWVTGVTNDLTVDSPSGHYYQK